MVAETVLEDGMCVEIVKTYFLDLREEYSFVEEADASKSFLRYYGLYYAETRSSIRLFL